MVGNSDELWYNFDNISYPVKASSSGTHLWMNDGIEVSASRMNLPDMRSLLPQKVGENNSHTKDVSSGLPKFVQMARMYTI